jgi:hypothetical protein
VAIAVAGKPPPVANGDRQGQGSPQVNGTGDHVAMGSWGVLYVGDLEVASIKYEVPPELLSVFTDDMYHSRAARSAEYYADTQLGDETVTVHEFTAPGPVIASRLDILGFTPSHIYAALNTLLALARDIGPFPAPDLGHDYAANDWVAEMRSPAISPAGESLAPGTIKWLMSHFEEEDARIALRAVLLARPDDNVRLDVTDLITGGWLDDDRPVGVCAAGLDTMRTIAAAHTPIVVLTEGKSDIAVLEPALRLFHPHLTDLIRFMDYTERPAGGAGPLVNTVRAFAAAGIANRVLALFDNDTGATDALRSLDLGRLPANIRVRQYPRIDLAAHYPTLGPPPADASVACTDVNGLAGSIEMYLGREVLTSPDGRLRPVQWRTYIQGAHQYQGEIADKQAVHDAYRAKVQQARADPSSTSQQDWSGIHAILDLIFHAFD